MLPHNPPFTLLGAGHGTVLDLSREGRVTAVGAATAIVVGLVAVTPAAGYVGPRAALALGALAAVPSYFALLAGNLWQIPTPPQ